MASPPWRTNDPAATATSSPRRTAAAASLALALTTNLAAQGPTPAPAYQPLRQNEDWSRFRAGPDADWSDRLKHVELGDSVWWSLGGRADARFEAWNGFGFGGRPATGAQPADPRDSDTWTLSRLMLHSDLHLGEHVRVFVEGRTAQATDRDLPGGRRTTDMDTLDVFQAFVDLQTTLGDDASLRLRLGRQSFVLGAQRVVSPLLWINVWNSWDGASAQFRAGDWSVQGLLTWYVPIDRTGANESDDERSLYGAYATKAAPAGGRGLDVYLLGNTRPNVTVNGTTGDERRHTLGARSFGALGSGFDAEVEAAFQTGRIGTASVDAWFTSTVLGLRPDGWALSPRFFLGLDAASGDDRSGGGVGTYHQLFPLGHAFFGFADAIGRQNIAAAHVGTSLQLAPELTVSLTGHVFRLLERSDALYGVNGTVSRAGLGNRDVGQEIDLYCSQRLHRHLEIYGGYSHLFAGGGITASGPSDDQDFLYLGVASVF